MQRLNNHPTVKRYHERKTSSTLQATASKLSARELRKMCIEAGADDVGFVEITRPSLADQKEYILKVFPWTRTLISFAGRINRENLRSPARSIASLELHQLEERLIHAARSLATALERKGVRASTPAPGFPMEADQWALRQDARGIAQTDTVEAGLGKMGLHRNVIHPVFGPRAACPGRGRRRNRSLRFPGVKGLLPRLEASSVRRTLRLQWAT